MLLTFLVGSPTPDKHLLIRICAGVEFLTPSQAVLLSHSCLLRENPLTV